MNFTNKYILSLFSFLIFAVNIQSQTTTIDSLKNELLIHTQKDTIRVNLLNDLANSYHNEDFYTALVYLKESETIAETIGFKKGIARSAYLKGLIHSVQSKYKDGIKYYNEALQLYETINFKRGVSECYAKMGLAHYYNSDYNKSIEYYKKSIDIDKNSNRIRTTAISLKNIGFCYMDLGNYEKAQEYLNYAMDLNIEYNNKLEVSSCLKNIGSIYLKKGNYPLALEHYNKSLAIYKTMKDTAGISTILNNTGIIYKNYKNYDKAIDNYKESLRIQKKSGDKKNMAITLNNIGVVYKDKEDYKNALIFLNDALKISKEINDRDNISRCLINIGDVYLGFKDNTVALKNFLEAKEINIEIGNQLGLCYSYLGIARVYVNIKNYHNALINAIKSKKISNKLGVIDYQRDVYNLLSIIYENTDNYKKAFESHQQFKVLNDSLFNKKNIEKIAQLEYEYKYKQAIDSASIRELKLTKTVTATNKDLEKSKQDYLSAIIGILLLSILLGGVIFYLKLRNVKSKAKNIVIEQRLLRSQMTPHFIFNSLSVLQGMILNKEDEKSVSYLSKFSKLLRITLENSRYKTVLLCQELTAIENYLTLQNLENKSYQYTVLVDDTIDRSLFKIPPMLIQPFIENAIEHAFGNQNENKKIDIHLSYLDKKLSCIITDNGTGIDSKKENKRKDKKSLATTITSERLKILSKYFKIEGSIRIEDRQKYNEQGTIVTLIIPYKIIVA